MKILRSKKEPETVFQCMTCPHPKPLDRCRTARIELFPALPSLSPRRNTAAANPPSGETPLDETRRRRHHSGERCPLASAGRAEALRAWGARRDHRPRFPRASAPPPPPAAFLPPNHGGAVSRSGISLSLSLSLSAGSEGDRCSRTRSGRLSGPDATAPRETSTSRLAHFCFAFWLMEKIRLVYPAKSSR
jgi:hypothetical protein